MLKGVTYPRKRIGHQVDALRVFIGAAAVRRVIDSERLTAVQVDERVNLPTVYKPLRSMCELRQGISRVEGEGVACIQCAVAIVTFEVEAVLRQQAPRLRDLIEAMAPRVVCLRGEPVKVGKVESCLKRIVVACGNSSQLVDVAIGRILVEERPTLLLRIGLSRRAW